MFWVSWTSTCLLLPLFVTIIKNTSPCFSLNCISRVPAVRKKRRLVTVTQYHRRDLAIGPCWGREYGKVWRSEQSTSSRFPQAPSAWQCCSGESPWALHGSSSSDLCSTQTPWKKSQVSAVGWLWSPLKSPSAGHGDGFYHLWVSIGHIPGTILQAFINIE